MSDLISTTKNNLKRFAPKAENIFIKIKRDKTLFLSKIHVHVPGKTLHAEKKAETPWGAVESAYQAILNQLNKIKKKQKNKRKILHHLDKFQGDYNFKS